MLEIDYNREVPSFNMHGIWTPLVDGEFIAGYVFPGGLTEVVNKRLLELGYKNGPNTNEDQLKKLGY